MRKNTKSALLLSVVSIIVCCTMLLGTTMAWFTDSVTSAKNVIVAGNLDMKLEWSTDYSNWDEVTATTNIFKENALWEPGYTEVVYLRVSNVGTLDFKTAIDLIVAEEVKGTNVAGDEFALSDYIYYDVVEVTEKYADRAAVEVAMTNTNVLADGYNKTGIELYDAEQVKTETDKKNAVTYALIAYMPTTVGNEANYRGETVPEITIGLEALATQLTSEEDSFDNTYDEDALFPGEVLVTNQEELNAAIADGADAIYLAEGTYQMPASAKGKTLTLNGSGHDTIIKVIPGGQGEANGQLDYSLDGSTVTFNDLTIETNSQLYAGYARLSATYNNCVIQNTYNLGVGDSVFNNCVFNITNEYLRVGGAYSAVFNGCTFNTDGRAILVFQDGTSVDQTVTVKDCTFNATAAAKTWNGIHVAAVSIDGTSGTYVVNLEGNNTVDTDFNGLWQIKAGEANVTVNENGTVVTTASATTSAALDAAIRSGADTVVLGAGNYIIPDSAQGKTLTIVGNGDTVVATQDDGSYEGCDYSLDGATVTFENITINTDSTTYTGYARLNATYNNCTINGTYTLYGDSEFNNCTFNVSGDVYNIWTWGAPNATFNDCTFNSDGKALLLYGQANTKLTVNNCTFNDNGGLTDLKAAIEIGNDYNKSYELIVNNTTVNGYEINDKGINTGTTLWANKNSMGTDKLNVVVDGVDVY